MLFLFSPVSMLCVCVFAKKKFSPFSLTHSSSAQTFYDLKMRIYNVKGDLIKHKMYEKAYREMYMKKH